MNNKEIGRILRASTSGFTIGSRVNQLSDPSFGCIVKAQPLDERESIYGLIYDMHIDDDPLARRLVLTDDPPPEVIEDQRNNRLLPIEMSVLTIGYEINGQLFQTLPPRPPLNLDPVFLCHDQTEVTDFTESFGYLRLIVDAPLIPAMGKQLVGAHIYQVYRLRGDDADWAHSAIVELIDILRGDYDRLMPTLEVINNALPNLSVMQAF